MKAPHPCDSKDASRSSATSMNDINLFIKIYAEYCLK